MPYVNRYNTFIIYFIILYNLLVILFKYLAILSYNIPKKAPARRLM